MDQREIDEARSFMVKTLGDNGEERQAEGEAKVVT